MRIVTACGSLSDHPTEGSIGVANSGLTKQNEAPVDVLPAFRFVLAKARERCEFAERSTLAPQEILSIKLRPYGGCF